MARTAKTNTMSQLQRRTLWPPGQIVFTPNLMPGGELVCWTEEDFFGAISSGQAPGGKQLNEEMPWKYYGQMTDEELKVVWLYLQSLPKLEQAPITR
jgi:hypothetical protein